MKKIFPQRFSKPNWKIPILSIHTCSRLCKSKIIITQDNRIHHEEIKCKYQGLIQHSGCFLDNFDITCPKTPLGNIYNLDVVYIKDSSFELLVDFPLFKPTKVKITGKNYYTLRDLLYIISKTYKNIYEEEEETCDEKEFKVSEKCKCADKLSHEMFINKDFYVKKKENTCSICLCEFNENEIVSTLRCNHFFHPECLNEWIVKKKNCPLCRTNIINCILCNGTEIYTFMYRSKILPKKYRDDSNYRNETNGKYGIYNFDFEDLILREMWYNRNLRQMILKLTIR